MTKLTPEQDRIVTEWFKDKALSNERAFFVPYCVLEALEIWATECDARYSPGEGSFSINRFVTFNGKPVVWDPALERM